MKVSYNWLKNYLNIDLPAVEVGELLTDTGLEVEGIETYETIKGGLEGVVVGHVLTCGQHPNADRLKVTTVDIGNENHLSIVCGAPNVAAGQKVLVATIGTKLYTPEGDEFKIKKGKIRGEVSEGMICAEDELGLGTSHDGIMVLEDNVETGTAASSYFNIESDKVFEIGLTPNRTDAMGHIGVARDLRAALLRKDITKDIVFPSVESFKVDNTNLEIPIEVENTAACGQYFGVTISGVEVKDSPDWLKHSLKAIGINPTNNVVDVTNYVLHETGHPLHAFDAAKIDGGKVVVRSAKAGEKFTTLDEKERELNENDLMISNASKSMCIAGVFGGIKSGVTPETKAIFLEAAWFDPVSIRKTARRHALNTDASFRYERGVDPTMTEYAMKRAVLLIQELAGGEISSDVQSSINKEFKEVEVEMSYQRINRLIGQELSTKDVKDILRSLDIEILTEEKDHFIVRVPQYRCDVTREADVIEEILRIYGLNTVNMPGTISFTMRNVDTKSSIQLRKKVNDYLISKGFTEIQNNSLTKREYSATFEESFPSKECVRILNPLSNDLGVMRQTLLFGGLEVIQRNVNHKNPNLRLAEFGKSYHEINGEYTENEVFALFVSGSETGETWNGTTVLSNFFTLKSQVVNLLSAFGIKGCVETVFQNELFTEGIELTIGDKVFARLGKVSEKAKNAVGVEQDVYYAEVLWPNFVKKHYRAKELFTELPKYPGVRRDLALLVDKDIKYFDLQENAFKQIKKILKEVNLFDVYEGKNLPDGKKSYAMSFTLQDSGKTLTDKQVDGLMNRLIKSYQEQFQAELR